VNEYFAGAGYSSKHILYLHFLFNCLHTKIQTFPQLAKPSRSKTLA